MQASNRRTEFRPPRQRLDKYHAVNIIILKMLASAGWLVSRYCKFSSMLKYNHPGQLSLAIPLCEGQRVLSDGSDALMRLRSKVGYVSRLVTGKTM